MQGFKIGHSIVVFYFTDSFLSFFISTSKFSHGNYFCIYRCFYCQHLTIQFFFFFPCLLRSSNSSLICPISFSRSHSVPQTGHFVSVSVCPVRISSALLYSPITSICAINSLFFLKSSIFLRVRLIRRINLLSTQKR